MIGPNESPEEWEHCLAVVRPALLLAPRTYMHDVQGRMAADGIVTAVDRHDTATLFDWIVRLLDRQGISNAAAIGFAEQHGSAAGRMSKQLSLVRPSVQSSGATGNP